MLLTWLDIRLARLGLAVAFVAITVLALMPAHEVPVTSGWDKLDHWTAFFTLSFLAAHAFPRRSFWQIALALVTYGIGIEVAQYFTPDRDADAMDVVADSIGVLIYWLLLIIYSALIKQKLRVHSD
jgi:VanZ family protein